MIKAHKIRLNPTLEQAHYFVRAAGTARFVFNWVLAEWKARYEAGEKPSSLSLKKQFNAIRREQFPWSYVVTKCAIEGAFMDVAAAFKHFFEGRKAGRNVGYPKFKRKKRSRQSFYLANDKFTVGDHWIDVPKLGRVNMAEKLVRRIVGRMLSTTNVVGTDGMFHAYSAYPPPRKRKATRACGDGHVGESHQFFEWSMQGVYGERYTA
jgi:putative transposase